MNDEQLAKQLHDLEIIEQQRRQKEQQRQDEEFARSAFNLISRLRKR